MDVDEREFQRREVTVTLPRDSCALVLVDVWDRHHIRSHHARCRGITTRVIRPLVQAARASGLRVIHAPGARAAAAHNGETHPAPPTDRWFGQPEAAPPDGPPEEDAPHPHLPAGAPPPAAPDPAVENLRAARRIAAEITPTPDEPVAGSGRDLLALIRRPPVRTLFFAGFAANICVPYRDYGMRAMRAAGLKVVLVRDATTAIEFNESLDHQSLLAAAIADIELNYGSTTTSASLITALTA